MLYLSPSWSCWPKVFNEELDSFYTKILRNAELLSGQDINLDMGTQSEMLSDVLGPNGIDNRNSKGNDFLFLLRYNKFRLLLTYFNHDNSVTWQSFNANKNPHMLDDFICAESLFCRVRNCIEIDKVTHSYHSAVQVKFWKNDIEFKVKGNAKVKFYWTTIGENLEKNELFNFNLFQILRK